MDTGTPSCHELESQGQPAACIGSSVQLGDKVTGTAPCLLHTAESHSWDSAGWDEKQGATSSQEDSCVLFAVVP